MTYKKMVEGMVEREACKWLESFIKNDGFTAGGTVTLRIDNGICYFDCLTSVLGTGSLVPPVYRVAGTVGETGTVYNSVIYTGVVENGMTKSRMVWASSQELRDMYSITEFEI